MGVFTTAAAVGAAAVGSLTFRCLPPFYHVRLISEFIHAHNMWKKREEKGLEALTARYTTTYRVWLDDIDINFHMSNSMYHKYADFNRGGWAGHSGILPHYKNGVYFLNAGVSVAFLREVKPLRRFDVSTRLISYDDKWFNALQVFHEVGEPDKVYAALVCRLIFKRYRGNSSVEAGGKTGNEKRRGGKPTVMPKEAFEMAGFVDLPSTLLPLHHPTCTPTEKELLSRLVTIGAHIDAPI
eukprot:CAMPEP_0113912298 /NCGR_PEP_ID=MMETSP0780_2-20120614/28846_1 /TAXON_ID=652834 /ORGANISM="Palpitomonas bilix" /LENGTH=239 /DNA_ID=CAMNT_0000909235 /DNA_START=171 /DNA_END=890 /DNA_ORIENTATION=- /assembly_acc=CAM_ASM_000599